MTIRFICCFKLDSYAFCPYRHIAAIYSAGTTELIMISVSLFFGFFYWDDRVITIQLVLETIDDIYVCHSTICIIKMDLAALKEIYMFSPWWLRNYWQELSIYARWKEPPCIPFFSTFISTFLTQRPNELTSHQSPPLQSFTVTYYQYSIRMYCTGMY
jgi:hypothetical protein